MSLATHGQIGPYAKFTLKQKAAMLAILHVPSATLANSLVVDSYSYRTWNAYAASDNVNNVSTSCRV